MGKNWLTMIVVFLIVFLFMQFRRRLLHFFLFNRPLRRVAVTIALRIPMVRKYMLAPFSRTS
ncbi:hypothetical protein SAMN05192534_10699 [Alteribacillus persepolensis]|uniref:Uncharacterized protein n=1 Tax=Alteribacillus persepolensis TaxID=568899 RepID=A0A1G8CVM2_9BACI|nr:hypothetical protein [Alteribacillus persepolensis]SDH49505.1 hypothetical protein SAMN05192534_10699 [Alteribacillus persepolensis]